VGGQKEVFVGQKWTTGDKKKQALEDNLQVARRREHRAQKVNGLSAGLTKNTVGTRRTPCNNALEGRQYGMQSGG